MAALSIVVLPLRLPNPQQDLEGILEQTLADRGCDASVLGDCRIDLQRLESLRHLICQQFHSKDAYDDAWSVVNELYEYYHGLKALLDKGVDALSPSSFLSGGGDGLEWESSLSRNVRSLPLLEWERSNWIWNLATLEAYQASKQSLDSKSSWNLAAQHFQNAASWLQQLPDEAKMVSYNNNNNNNNDFLSDFNQIFISFWQAILMAKSQRCVYESVACAPRPKHLLLAKLAAAAGPLFDNVEEIVRKDEEEGGGLLSVLAPSTTNDWADVCRAWGVYMRSKAEHHQALLSKDKNQWGQELARLDEAFRCLTLCREYCERAPLRALQQLHTTVDITLYELQQRMEQAEQENAATHHQPIPRLEELTEIRGQTLVKLDQPLGKFLQPLAQGKEFFLTLPVLTTLPSWSSSPFNPTSVAQQPPPQSMSTTNLPSSLSHASNDNNYTRAATDDNEIGRCMNLFHSEMEKFASFAEERTESARKALATVNLPHSLTAYHQEQAGGGIPDDLWQRVESIQREQRITKLQQDLWLLRDMGESARTTYQEMEHQLDLDLDGDQLFRQDQPRFEGHDVEEVQTSFRQSLENYDRLLVTAQQGDSVLLRRLEILDTNPKYKLLQFPKSQLDRLLPGSDGGPNTLIDTSNLVRLLGELSALFHERDGLLNTFKQDVKDYDIRGLLQKEQRQGAGGNSDYRETLKYARKSFDGIVDVIQNNIKKQKRLVDSIMDENERFMMERSHSQNAQSGDSCIVMIEDGIEEIEQLSKHLKEGKDFYKVVIPKLEKLKQQIGDVSARLTVERLEYADKATRYRQEEEDARMANALSRRNDGSRQNNTNGGNPTPRGQPGMTQVQNDQPQVFVDDEKVATLVAMEFDPAEVVAALMKSNNNVDQALNDLLSG